MHDASADRDRGGERNRTLELTEMLIPKLRDRGYRFVRLDDVPEIAALIDDAASPALTPRIRVLTAGPSGTTVVADAALEAEDGYTGRLCTEDGLYLIPPSSPSAFEWTRKHTYDPEGDLDILSLGDDTIALRTRLGFLISSSNDDRPAALADTRFISHAEIHRLG